MSQVVKKNRVWSKREQKRTVTPSQGPSKRDGCFALLLLLSLPLLFSVSFPVLFYLNRWLWVTLWGFCLCHSSCQFCILVYCLWTTWHLLSTTSFLQSWQLQRRQTNQDYLHRRKLEPKQFRRQLPSSLSLACIMLTIDLQFPSFDWINFTCTPCRTDWSLPWGSKSFLSWVSWLPSSISLGVDTKILLQRILWLEMNISFKSI